MSYCLPRQIPDFTSFNYAAPKNGLVRSLSSVSVAPRPDRPSSHSSSVMTDRVWHASARKKVGSPHTDEYPPRVPGLPGWQQIVTRAENVTILHVDSRFVPSPYQGRSGVHRPLGNSTPRKEICQRQTHTSSPRPDHTHKKHGIPLVLDPLTWVKNLMKPLFSASYGSR